MTAIDKHPQNDTFTARQMSLENPVLNVRSPSHVRDFDVVKNQLDAMVQVINGGLDALSPSVGTARELSDSERDLAKLGLNIAKLVFESVKSLRVGHKQ